MKKLNISDIIITARSFGTQNLCKLTQSGEMPYCLRTFYLFVWLEKLTCSIKEAGTTKRTYSNQDTATHLFTSFGTVPDPVTDHMNAG